MENTTPDRPRASGREHAPMSGSPGSQLSLERIPLTLVDRWLPAHPVPFVAVVFLIAGACWALGLVLAADRQRFLASPDWQLQPVFFATHLVILRLFVTSYAKNFLAGCRHLTIAREDADRRVRRTLGTWGWALAAALAAPLVWHDVFDYLTGPEYVANGEAMGPGGTLGWTDWLLGSMWTVEWVINAYIWVVIGGFLALTMRVIKAFPFRGDLELVLGERHYRPFLFMSAQGATIVLLFSIVDAVYVWRVEGEWTDYLGLWVTAGLLLVGFVPPWMRLKGGLARTARAEADRLNRQVHQGWEAIEREDAGENPGAPVLARLKQLLALARAGHLERLIRDFGRNEGQAMLLRLLAPLSTMIWKIIRPG